MSVVKSALSASPEELRANREFYDGRVADLRARRAAAVAVGTEAARAALREAGQLLVRERVSALLDPGSPFLELCQLAGEGLHGDTVPGAGIVAGVGLVSGRPCMVIANDAAVHDGAYSAITSRVSAGSITMSHQVLRAKLYALAKSSKVLRTGAL